MNEIKLTNEEYECVVAEIGEFFADLSAIQLPRKLIRRSLLTKEGIEGVVSGKHSHLEVTYTVHIIPAVVRMLIGRVKRKSSSRNLDQNLSSHNYADNSAKVVINEGSLRRKKEKDAGIESPKAHLRELFHERRPHEITQKGGDAEIAE